MNFVILKLEFQRNIVVKFKTQKEIKKSHTIVLKNRSRVTTFIFMTENRKHMLILNHYFEDLSSV